MEGAGPWGHSMPSKHSVTLLNAAGARTPLPLPVPYGPSLLLEPLS